MDNSWPGNRHSAFLPSNRDLRAAVRVQSNAFHQRIAVSVGKRHLLLEELGNACIQYCIQLSTVDLSYCDDLAFWLFTQVCLIAQTIKDEAQLFRINTFINQCTIASPWKSQFNTILSELDGSSQTRVKSELYPNESDDQSLGDDNDDDDYTHIHMNDLSLNDEILEMSITDLNTLSIGKIQFVNIQEREFQFDGFNIININSISHLNSIMINHNCNLIVFFTRSESITITELEIYRMLSSNTRLPPSYWLTGGYQSFKKFINQQQKHVKPLSIPPLVPQPRQLHQPQLPPIASIPTIYSTSSSSSFIQHPVQQPSVYTQPPALRPPHPNPHLEFSKIPPTLIGLPNYGSTCYINSMIQCLFRLDHFRKYLLDLDTNEDIPLTSMFKNLFESFYKLSYQSNVPPIVNIISLLKIINAKNPNLNIPNEQQDTSQFLYMLLNDLHMELKTDLKVIPNFNGNEKLKSWYKSTYLAEDGFSKIQDFFQIINEIEMKCTRCGYSSIKYETSNVLHLNLKNSANTPNFTTLNKIIDNNLTNEEMSERLGNAWDCDGCREIERKMKKLADLVNTESSENEKDRLHSAAVAAKKNNSKFKMFKSSKNDSKSSRPSTPIDLRYMTERELNEYEQLSHVITKDKIANRIVKFVKLPDVLVICFTIFDPFHPDAKINTDNLNFPLDLTLGTSDGRSRRYKLKSRIDHLGTSIESGHYTAVVFSEQNKTWVECDDEKLSTLPSPNSQILHDKNVYLLFYESVS